jgi:hypothetical protein
MYKKLLVVDIYPTDVEPIRNASLLKVNDTNVRFMDGKDCTGPHSSDNSLV